MIRRVAKYLGCPKSKSRFLKSLPCLTGKQNKVGKHTERKLSNAGRKMESSRGGSGKVWCPDDRVKFFP